MLILRDRHAPSELQSPSLGAVARPAAHANADADARKPTQTPRTLLTQPHNAHSPRPRNQRIVRSLPLQRQEHDTQQYHRHRLLVQPLQLPPPHAEIVFPQPAREK